MCAERRHTATTVTHGCVCVCSVHRRALSSAVCVCYVACAPSLSVIMPNTHMCLQWHAFAFLKRPTRFESALALGASCIILSAFAHARAVYLL